MGTGGAIGPIIPGPAIPGPAIPGIGADGNVDGIDEAPPGIIGPPFGMGGIIGG